MFVAIAGVSSPVELARQNKKGARPIVDVVARLVATHAKRTFAAIAGVSSPVEIAVQNKHVAKQNEGVLARVLALSAARHDESRTSFFRQLYRIRRRAGCHTCRGAQRTSSA